MKKSNVERGSAHNTYSIAVAGGFTLIELLVVVAIIGILASVVLASLNSARGKGGDAAVKSNLANIRSQAEIIYSGSVCYGDGTPITDTTCVAFAEAVCPTLAAATADSIFKNAVVNGQVTAAIAAGGPNGGVCSSEAGGTAWGVAVALKAIPANSWCVDSTGASKLVVVTTPANALTNSKCN